MTEYMCTLKCGYTLRVGEKNEITFGFKNDSQYFGTNKNLFFPYGFKVPFFINIWTFNVSFDNL